MSLRANVHAARANVHAEARRFLRSLIDDETRCEEWVASLGLPHHGIYWRRISFRTEDEMTSWMDCWLEIQEMSIGRAISLGPCRTFSEYTCYLEVMFRRDAEEECSGLVAPDEPDEPLQAEEIDQRV